jgi:hypothetical protein
MMALTIKAAYLELSLASEQDNILNHDSYWNAELANEDP